MDNNERKIEEIPDRFKKPHIDVVKNINNPLLFPEPMNPTVPNRAWTEMKNGVDIDMMTEEEKRDLYIGHDNIF